MVRKVFKAGNSLVVSLPRESIQALGLQEGSEVSVEVVPDQQEIVIRFASPPWPGSTRSSPPRWRNSSRNTGRR
jgi:antitoxin component of MazEF toxin-antitoxin module